MRSLYVDGDGFLHRLPAGVKLAALMALSILLFLVTSPIVLAGALAVGLAAHFSLRMSAGEFARRMLPLVLVIGIVAVFTAVFNDPLEGLNTFLRLVALGLFASLVTASTTTGDFIDVITRAAVPLERIGILKAADLGLALGLVIRFVPEIVGRYTVIRDAHYARGLKPRPVSIIVPLIISTLRNADEIAAAIDARGIRRQN